MIKDKILNTIESDLDFTTKGDLHTIGNHHFMGRKLTHAQKCGRVLLIAILALAILTGVGALIAIPLGGHKKLFKWVFELHSGHSILGKMHRHPFPVLDKRLPSEMEKKIFSYCDTKSLVLLSQTSSRFFNSPTLNAEITSRIDCFGNNKSYHFRKYHLDRFIRQGVGLLHLSLAPKDFFDFHNPFEPQQIFPESLEEMHRLLKEKKLYEKCPHLHTLKLNNFEFHRGWDINANLIDLFTAEMLRDLIPPSVERLEIVSDSLRSMHLTCLPTKVSSLKVGGRSLHVSFFALLSRMLKELIYVDVVYAADLAALPPTLEQLRLHKVYGNGDFSHLKNLHTLELSSFQEIIFSPNLKKFIIHEKVSQEAEIWLKSRFDSVKSQNGKTTAERI